MPLIYIGRGKPFSSRTYTTIHPSPFLDGLVDYDFHLRRSPVTQSLIESDLKEFHNDFKKPNDPCVDYAIYHTSRQFMLSNQVKMLHLNDVFKQDLDIWSKSPGLPWTEMGIKTKGQIRDDPERIRQVRHFWHEIKRGKDIKLPDCCAFVRSHICDKDEHKVRAVWGYPATVTFAEAMFALPLIEAYTNLTENNKPIAYGYETFNGGAQRVRRRFIRNTPTTYTCIDFKKFDKTVPVWMIRVAFDILRYNIDFVHYRDRGVADVRNMYRMFKVLEEYFIKTKIRTATGKRFCKVSGIASGSYFTQLVGSICNSLALNYTFIKVYGRPPIDALFLGDDSICSSTHKVNLTRLADVARDDLGMIFNIKKSETSPWIDDLTFLGFQINHGLARKKESDLIASLVFPETPDTCWDDVASRALGLYYANLGMNADFAELTWKIVNYREFELSFGRNFSKMLTYLGITIDHEKRLPIPVEFMRKLLLYN